jgi:hypothetical protein
MQQPPISLPYCVFNGGTDAWLDIGNKSVGVAALQAYFHLDPATCLHVGDQVSELLFHCALLLVAEAAKFRFLLANCSYLLQLSLPPANCFFSAVCLMFIFF